MIVTVYTPSAPPRHAYGPRDLGTVGPGSTLVVDGSHNRDRDFGRWAGAIGSAVLRGASVTRRSSA